MDKKRVDITKTARDLIVKAFGEYRDGIYEEKSDNGQSMICKAKVLDAVSLGYNKVVVESPIKDDDGKLVLKRGKKQLDTSKRDTENIPLDEDIDEYFEREILPQVPVL